MQIRSTESEGQVSWAPTPTLEGRAFELFRSLVAQSCGIKLSNAKSLLVQNRVGKRLRALRMESFEEYLRYLRSPEGRRKELRNFLSAITTNETHFFREPHHFELLTGHLLPDLTARRPSMATLRVWSAGCSTGQEVYTLAMVMEEWSRANGGRRYSVLGTDIDWRALEIAEGAQYPGELAKEVPPEYLSRYTAFADNVLRIKPELRRRVSFRRLNFIEAVPQRPRLDVIFCRNAIMYLDRETRLLLARVFRDSLLEGGYLVLGSSESLHGLPRLFHTARVNRSLVYQKCSGIGGGR